MSEWMNVTVPFNDMQTLEIQNPTNDLCIIITGTAKNTETDSGSKSANHSI